jgi:hypothetical protein
LHTYFILTAGSTIAKVGAGVRDNTHAIMEFRIETSENKNSLIVKQRVYKNLK